MEYEKQVKALRCCAGANPPGTKCPFYDEYWCGNECLDKRLEEAADAIEALMDGEKTYLAELAQCHENLRRAAETIRERDERIEALQEQLPKRGEWIVTTETSDDGAVSQHINCSVCGFYWREPKHRKVFKRCPNCGAKMEVQDDKA